MNDPRQNDPTPTDGDHRGFPPGHERFDVVVVGAGLAGLQCARLLAERSVSVLVVDRKKSLERAIHTTGIFVRRTFEEFRFPPRVLGPPVRHVVLHSPAGRSQTLESPDDEFRIARMGALYTGMLEEAVRSGARALTGAHFRSAVEDGDDVAVGLDVDGRETVVRCRYLIGADGAASRVARALGLATVSEVIVGVEEILHGVPLDGPPTLHCYLDPELAPGYIGWVAHDGHELHLGVGGLPGAFSPADSLARLRRRVARQVDLAAGRVVERRGGRIPVGGLLPAISSPLGLLVGDAAGAVSPLTAGGLDGAMRLSRFAVEVLTTAIAQDDRRLLALYPGEGLDTRFLSRRGMRRLLSAVQSPGLVEAGCALLRTPPLAALARHVFFGRGSFPEPDRAPLLASCALSDR